jgi:hypothetical protein
MKNARSAQHRLRLSSAPPALRLVRKERRERKLNQMITSEDGAAPQLPRAHTHSKVLKHYCGLRDACMHHCSRLTRTCVARSTVQPVHNCSHTLPVHANPAAQRLGRNRNRLHNALQSSFFNRSKDRTGTPAAARGTPPGPALLAQVH